jgi:hypothetical protein
MATVFVLQHVHTFEDGTEDIKFIGVYSSRDNADAAVARLGRQPGFSEAREGFRVDQYRVDEDNWIEGYVSVAGA